MCKKLLNLKNTEILLLNTNNYKYYSKTFNNTGELRMFLKIFIEDMCKSTNAKCEILSNEEGLGYRILVTDLDTLFSFIGAYFKININRIDFHNGV